MPSQVVTLSPFYRIQRKPAVDDYPVWIVQIIKNILGGNDSCEIHNINDTSITQILKPLGKFSCESRLSTGCDGYYAAS